MGFSLNNSAENESWLAFVRDSNLPEVQAVILRTSEQAALARNLTILFYGVYSQAKQGCSEEPLNMPFVIAQNPIQRRLPTPALEASVIETPFEAQISGGILRKNYVKFEKLYLPSELLGGAKFNPVPVFYEGISLDGKEYAGEWSFDERATVNLEGKGMFKLLRADRGNLRVR